MQRIQHYKPTRRHKADDMEPTEPGSEPKARSGAADARRRRRARLRTVPDSAALALLPKAPGEISRWCVRRVAAASVLTGERTQDGRWSGFRLPSCLERDAPEERILEHLDAAARPVLAGDSTLVTYGGRRHEVGVLRRRAAHQLRMDLTGLTRLRNLDAHGHRDVMQLVAGPGSDRLATLRDVCAGLGIKTGATAPPSTSAPLPTLIRKKQVDIVATFLVHLYEQALEVSNAAAVLRGWDPPAAHLRSKGSHWTHLAQFRRNLPIAAQGGANAFPNL